MRVLVLAPCQKGHSPGQRSNIEIWEPDLRNAGIETVFEPFESDKLRAVLYKGGNNLSKLTETVLGCWRRLAWLKHIDEFDAVYVFREAALLGPAFLERMIARKRPLIFHFDDPIFVPYRSPANGYLSYLKFFGKIKEIIAMSRLVIVNSEQLRDYALQFNKDVRRITNSFDPAVYSFAPEKLNSDGVCVGWSGSTSTLKNLQLVASPLARLAATENEFRFHAIGGTDVDIPQVNFTAQAWRAETEVDDLRKMQIGLIPLPDVEWNKYKFIMKTPQYMALGIVPVGTPMSSNPEVIRHGENGFLAATDDDWVNYLTLLIQDAGLRNRLSKAAAADAHAKYSLPANIPKVIEAFRAAIA